MITKKKKFKLILFYLCHTENEDKILQANYKQFMKIKNNLFWYLNATSVISTVLILVWVLKFSAYGIDFTDEGYYLNWISNPSLYKTSINQFGFIYHPLYNLVDGNIVWLRRLNVIIIFTLSFALTYFLIKKNY